SGNLLGARNYPARGWVDDPRTPLAANSGSLISSEMSLHHHVEKHGTGIVLHQEFRDLRCQSAIYWRQAPIWLILKSRLTANLNCPQCIVILKNDNFHSQDE
ncbi:hypothetical protein MJG53_017602, partial [Ovis ammon polii x Ovis aries]